MEYSSGRSTFFIFWYSSLFDTYVNNGWHDFKFSKALKGRKKDGALRI
jgi:hypothetical protein